MMFSRITVVVLVWVSSVDSFSPASLRGELGSLSPLRMDIMGEGDNGINADMKKWSSNMNEREQSLLEVQESIAAAEARRIQLLKSRIQLERELQEAEEARARLQTEVSQLGSTPEFDGAALATGLATPLAAVAGVRTYLSNRSQVQKQQAAKAAAIRAARIDTRKKKSNFLPNPLSVIKEGAMGIHQNKKKPRSQSSVFASKAAANGNVGLMNGMFSRQAKSFSFPDVKDWNNGKKGTSRYNAKISQEDRDNKLRGAVATAAAAAWILGSATDHGSILGQNTNMDESNSNTYFKTQTELFASNGVSKVDENAPIAVEEATSPAVAASTVTLANNDNNSPEAVGAVNDVQMDEVQTGPLLASIMAELDTPATTMNVGPATAAPNVMDMPSEAKLDDENLNFGATFAPIVNDDSQSSVVAKVENPVEMAQAPVVVEPVAPEVAAIVDPTMMNPVVETPAPAKTAPLVAEASVKAPVPVETPGETVYPFAKTATPPMKLDMNDNKMETEKTILPFASVATPPRMPSNEDVTKASSGIFSSIRAPDLVSSAKDVRSNFLKAFATPPAAVAPEQKVTLHPTKPKEVHSVPFARYAAPIGGAAALSFAAVAIAVGSDDEDEYEEYMSSEYEDYNSYMKANQASPPMVPATASGPGLRSYNSIPSKAINRNGPHVSYSPPPVTTIRPHAVTSAPVASRVPIATQVPVASRVPAASHVQVVPPAPVVSHVPAVENSARLHSSKQENGRMPTQGTVKSYLESLPNDYSKTPTGQGTISYLDRL